MSRAARARRAVLRLQRPTGSERPQNPGQCLHASGLPFSESVRYSLAIQAGACSNTGYTPCALRDVAQRDQEDSRVFLVDAGIR